MYLSGLFHDLGLIVFSEARDLARELFKNEFDAKIFYMAGLVHDIGKLRTPIGILHKPGKLGKYEAHIWKRYRHEGKIASNCRCLHRIDGR